MLRVMVTPFGLVAACEHRNVEPGSQRLWASIKVDPRGQALETARAPLAVTLVVDVSGSMQGDPIAHVLKSCDLLADLLTERDELAIVTFSTDAQVRCGLTRVDPAGRDQLRRALAGIAADGNTNMHAGLGTAAGVLMAAPAGLRRVIVLLSDGQPNVGLASPAELGAYVKSLKLAVSTLGFGLQHDENVLDAIATAGSGRYAYIPDPVIARVDLARAALAHGGIVADQLELRIAPAEGVELLQVLPATQLRHGKHGLAASIGDVFVDEGRALALELQLDLRAGASGRLAELTLEGRAPDGTAHRLTATLEVDVRSGPRVVDPAAQREIILVQADAARSAARAQADRRAMPAAAAILRQLAARIDAVEGFSRTDGSVLADLREQLEDEIAQYERDSSDLERVHQRKQSMVYKSATPTMARAAAMVAPVPAWLRGIGGPVAGKEFLVLTEMLIGRVAGNAIAIPSSQLSKHHARLVFANQEFVLVDLGSTNGTSVNGKKIRTVILRDGDLIELGDAVLRFQLDHHS